MRIKNINSNVTLNRSNESIKPTNEEESEANTQKTLVATNKVTLTQAMNQMGHLKQTARNVSTDNSVHIAELKLAIQDGSYQVNAEKVANNLLQTESFLHEYNGFFMTKEQTNNLQQIEQLPSLIVQIIHSLESFQKALLSESETLKLKHIDELSTSLSIKSQLIEKITSQINPLFSRP